MLVIVIIMIAVLLWTARCKKPGRDGHRMGRTELAGSVEAVTKWTRNSYSSTEKLLPCGTQVEARKFSSLFEHGILSRMLKKRHSG